LDLDNSRVREITHGLREIGDDGLRNKICALRLWAGVSGDSRAPAG